MKIAKKGASTHSLNRRQLEVGKFHNAAKRICEKYPNDPEVIKDILQMIKVYGNLVDDVYFENKGSKIADVMIELLDLDIEKK